MKTLIDGQLEIHHNRGVIYFHSSETGASVLRVCSLPTPIPAVSGRQLDITHLHGTDWEGATMPTGSPSADTVVVRPFHLARGNVEDEKGK